MRLVSCGSSNSDDVREISLAWAAACQRKGFMSSRGGAASRMGVFRACPGPTVGSSAGLPKVRKRLLQGNNSEFPPIPPFCAKNRLENHCESSSLQDQRPEIPCAAEQGINSTGTGNPIFENRELIRHNRESGAKPRRTRCTSNTFSVEDKKIIHTG